MDQAVISLLSEEAKVSRSERQKVKSLLVAGGNVTETSGDPPRLQVVAGPKNLSAFLCVSDFSEKAHMITHAYRIDKLHLGYDGNCT